MANAQGLENLEKHRWGTVFGAGGHKLCEGIARHTGKRCGCVAVKGRRFCARHGGKAGTVLTDPAGSARRRVRQAAKRGLVPAHVLALAPVIRDTLGHNRRRSLAGAVLADRVLQAYLSGDPEAWARALAELRGSGDGK